ncbi:MAG: phage holin family protein [Desulfobacteraceae bacterium]|nr:phage holin family protein [Desulfobacteraceae bacterium]
MSPVREERSISQLFSDLTTELSTLFRQEVALARTEISEDVSKVAIGAVSMGAGAIVAFVGLLALVEAAILGLANAVPPWLSALIVGIAVTGIGMVLLLMGRSRMLMAELMPRRTVDSLQEDKRLAQEHLRT